MKLLPVNYFLLSTLLLAGCATAPKPAPVGEVLSLIKQQYIDDVSDEKLVAGCRNGINQSLNSPPNSMQQIENKTTNSISTLLDITEIIASFKHQSPQSEDNHKLETSCLKGMARELDKQSIFLDEDEFKQLTDLQYGASIGVEYSIEADFPKITSVMENSPAEKAGLKTGDIIVKIDLAQTKDMPSDEVLKLLRGVADTKITLTAQRTGTKDPMEFAMKRDVVRIQSVKWQSLSLGLAYIRIAQFQSKTPSLFAQAIKNLYLENGGKLQGLILDLRNNPGGLFTESIAIPSAFLPSGSLVTYTSGRGPDSNMRLTAVPNDYSRSGNADSLQNLPPDIKTLPVVVLVNKATCSGAEIVAAALQDHKRAKLVGTHTFSHGRITTIFPLNNNTALKLTTAKLYRPNGMEINELGVTPDITIEANTLAIADFRTANDTQFNEALSQLKDMVLSPKN